MKIAAGLMTGVTAAGVSMAAVEVGVPTLSDGVEAQVASTSSLFASAASLAQKIQVENTNIALPPSSTSGYVVSPTLEGAAPLRAAFAVSLGLTPTIGTPEIYDTNKGAFRFVCGGKGRLRYDDPLVYPNQPGRAHLHKPWGNAAFSATMTAESMTNQATTDCNVTQYSLNRSSYWMPALVNDQAEAIEPDLTVVYYKQWASNSAPCTPGSGIYVGKCLGLPNKIRFVFGWDAKNPTAPNPGMHWYCTRGVNNGSKSTALYYKNLDDVFANGCIAGDLLTATTQGPNCWDGKYLDTPDHRSHVAYTYVNGYGKPVCPTTHPFTIPQQENKTQWTVTADMYAKRSTGIAYSRIRLSSDAMLPGAKPGETMHADYVEGWVWEAKKAWQDNCIQKRLSCNSGALGNGYRLTGAAKPAYGWVNPNPRVKLNTIS